MNRIRFARIARMLVAVTLAAAPLLAIAKGKEESKKKDAGSGLEYTAVILPPAGSSNITPSEIRFKIDRFTTPEEKETLRSILAKDGQVAALSHAQKTPIGRLIRAGGLGVDILFAGRQTTDKGDRIVIVTPRAPVYPGAMMNVDTMEFPFLVAWFVPVPGGKGEGSIEGATALRMSPTGEVDVQAYKASVGNLANVKARDQ